MSTIEDQSCVMIEPRTVREVRMELVRVNCPICGSMEDSVFTYFNGYRIAECKACMFVFVNPRPTEQALARLYASVEQNKYAGESYEPVEYERPVLDKILRYLSGYRLAGRLVEVGCGRGDFLRLAIERGFSAEGCDFLKDSEPDVSGAIIHTGSLRAANLRGDSVDVVVIRNTLEHLFDPKVELQEIHRIVKPGGYMYLKVPNFDFEQGLRCRIVFGKENAYEAPYHLNHFTPRSIKQLLWKSGFEFVEWYVEQPSLRPKWKTNLLRQAGYKVSQGLQWITAGRAFPKVLLCCLARKTEHAVDNLQRTTRDNEQEHECGKVLKAFSVVDERGRWLWVSSC